MSAGPLSSGAPGTVKCPDQPSPCQLLCVCLWVGMYMQWNYKKVATLINAHQSSHAEVCYARCDSCLSTHMILSFTLSLVVHNIITVSSPCLTTPPPALQLLSLPYDSSPCLTTPPLLPPPPFLALRPPLQGV